jgi:hypothetical protein
MKKTFYRTLEVGDPYEAPETLGVYESLDLIKDKDCVKFLRKATDDDKKNLESKHLQANYVKSVYENIHTKKLVGIGWSGPDGIYVEEIEVHLKDN